MNFIEAAIRSSDIYYNYLTKNKGSSIKYTVEKIEITSVYSYLYLTNNINLLDNLKIKINSNIFTNEQYKILEYDSDKKKLKIAPELKLMEFLLSAKASEVEIIVDLRFLIKNVKTFYEHYGHLLNFPRYINNVEYKEDKRLTDTPSEEQMTAVHGALSNPLTYIWGAPGTGKTRFVLARCILSYLQSKSNAKILITAPTNNAVEQTLRGVLPVLNTCGIKSEEVYRMGVPSADFLQKYSNCCEYHNIESQLENVKKMIDEIELQIKDTEIKISIYPEYKKSLEFEKQLFSCEIEIPNLYSEMLVQYEESEKLKKDILINNGKIAYAQTQLSQLNKNKNDLAESIKQYNEQINKLSQGIRKIFFKKKLNYYISLLRLDIEACNNVDKEIAEYNNIILIFENENIYITHQINECKNEFTKLLDEAEQKTAFWSQLNNIVKNTKFDSIQNSLNSVYKKIDTGKKSLQKRQERYTDIQNVTEDKLYEEYAFVLEKKKYLLSKYDSLFNLTPGARLASCRVLAATIDTLISRVTPDSSFKPNHIFLDEAGYCSLIKGVTLLTYNCPITLLGDHMQLPPICEMNDDEFTGDNQLVALYAQSALYIEDYILSPIDIVLNYLNHNTPQFKHLVNYSLNHTFRFGEKLANILAKSVYSPLFHGSTDNDTVIYYVNSPKIDPAKPRYSSTEIENIYKYFCKYNNENIGIITPYREQNNKLIEFFQDNTNILTVHGSQGREWDTVLLSVVDSTNKWFTNSNNHKSNGLRVINTAVSRVKKKLIIFCDVDHWKTQHNQLIGQLIQIGEELLLKE